MEPGTGISGEKGGDAGGGRLIRPGDTASARSVFRRPGPKLRPVAHPLQPIQCLLYEIPQTMRPRRVPRLACFPVFFLPGETGGAQRGALHHPPSDGPKLRPPPARFD